MRVLLELRHCPAAQAPIAELTKPLNLPVNDAGARRPIYLHGPASGRYLCSTCSSVGRDVRRSHSAGS